MQSNVLFITCHDLGQHIGCYGRRTVHSPAIDHLAERGVLFENSFCTAPQCSPSRAALHTGRHAHSVGMLGLAHDPFRWRLHPDEKHAAQWFKDAGYDTALFGVQHLTKTEDVADLGFQWYESEDSVVPAPELAKRVREFLRDPRRTERPFYLEIGFFEPHRPYDWRDTLPDTEKGVEVLPYLPNTSEAQEEFAALQGMIRNLDDAVGRILKTLEDADLQENTWVIFTTDHGLAMPRAKCTLYDPGIETALVMSWPGGGINGGKRCEEMISHVDVLPTLMEGLGLTLAANLHGKSFWDWLQGNDYQPNTQVFAEKTYHTAYEPMRGIRTSTHKLIVNFEVDTRVNVPDDIRQGLIYPQMIDQLSGHRDYIELYDLMRDPGETDNIAGRAEVQEIEHELKRRLLTWMRETDDPLLSGAVASPFYNTARDLLTMT